MQNNYTEKQFNNIIASIGQVLHFSVACPILVVKI